MFATYGFPWFVELGWSRTWETTEVSEFHPARVDPRCSLRVESTAALKAWRTSTQQIAKIVVKQSPARVVLLPSGFQRREFVAVGFAHHCGSQPGGLVGQRLPIAVDAELVVGI